MLFPVLRETDTPMTLGPSFQASLWWGYLEPEFQIS